MHLKSTGGEGLQGNEGGEPVSNIDYVPCPGRLQRSNYHIYKGMDK